MYQNLLSVQVKVENIQSVLRPLKKCSKTDSAQFESDEFYILRTFDYNEIQKKVLCVQVLVESCIQECFPDTGEPTDDLVGSAKEDIDLKLRSISKSGCSNDVKNENNFEQDKLQIKNVEGELQKRKRKKNEAPPKSVMLPKKSKKINDKLQNDSNLVRNIETESSFDQRRNLTRLISKICSLPDAHSIPSSFDVLHNKPSTLYGLSG